jgi:hypothetical protein
MRAAGDMMCVTQVQMGVGMVGEWTHGAADKRDRLLWVAARSGDDAQHMQGVWVVGRLGENALVELRGAIEPTGAVMLERNIKVRGEGGPRAKVSRQLRSALPVSAFVAGQLALRPARVSSGARKKRTSTRAEDEGRAATGQRDAICLAFSAAGSGEPDRDPGAVPGPAGRQDPRDSHNMGRTPWATRNSGILTSTGRRAASGTSTPSVRRSSP